MKKQRVQKPSFSPPCMKNSITCSKEIVWKNYTIFHGRRGCEREEPGSTVILGSRREKPQICPEAIWKGFSKKVAWPIAHHDMSHTTGAQ